MTAQTITERVLNNTEAYEWLDQNHNWIFGGWGESDRAETRREYDAGTLTPAQHLDMLNGVSEDAAPVTTEQFERWLDVRGYWVGQE